MGNNQIKDKITFYVKLFFNPMSPLKGDCFPWQPYLDYHVTRIQESPG
jgi:hypothetical protein